MQLNKVKELYWSHSESAEIWHADSSYVEKFPIVFVPTSGKRSLHTCNKVHPLPLPPKKSAENHEKNLYVCENKIPPLL